MIDEKKLIEDIKKEQCTLYEDDSQGDCQEYEPVNGMYAANVMRAIERQPKIGEWIPCSDRLPEWGTTTYLVCLKNGGIFLAVFLPNGEFKEMSSMGTREFCDNNPVIAWQLLPEPYHEEKTEAGI